MTETKLPDNVIVFDQDNQNWANDVVHNELFLRGIKNHSNNLLALRGYVFLNDILDMLGVDRTRYGQTHGWICKRGEDIEFYFSLVPGGGYKIAFNVQGEILDELP